MSSKNKLSEVIFDLLITRKANLISIPDAVEMLIAKYSEHFSRKKLYKHLYQQLAKCEAYGYINLSKKDSSSNIIFEVTEKFLHESFELSSMTKLHNKKQPKEQEKVSKTQRCCCEDDFFHAAIKKKIHQNEIIINECNNQNQEINKVLALDPSYTAHINSFYDETTSALKNLLLNLIIENNKN